MTTAVVTAAGVDTWSPSWYVNPDGPAAKWMEEQTTTASSHGSELLGEKVLDYRVGWFKSGLIFAEGHPDPYGGLCPANELVARTVELQDALLDMGLPLNLRERPIDNLGATSEGFAGLRRADYTVNVNMASRSEGVALLAGIAACVRDAPGKGQVIWGPDRGVETAYLRGPAGKAVLGRWYDKGLEAAIAERGTMIRGEDQRRYPKGKRVDPDQLDADALRTSFRRRFYPLYKATKGVTVGGPVVLAEKLKGAVDAGELTRGEAKALAGHMILELAGGVGDSRWTRNRHRARMRDLGLVLGDGVLEEVEVDVGSILEAALDTDLWERRG